MIPLTIDDLTSNDLYSLSTQIKTSNFKKTFFLLEKEKKIAISNLYLFCAYLDDIVDNPLTIEFANERLNH